MAKVRNCTNRVVELLGWKLLPDSDYAIDPSGNRTDHIPVSVAHSSPAKRLAHLGVLKIDGYSSLTESPPTVVQRTKPAQPEGQTEAPQKQQPQIRKKRKKR